MHGNNKSIQDLERAVEVGVGRVVIDSLIEIERLNAIVDENNDKHRYHLKEIEASFKTKFDDFVVKMGQSNI